MSKPSARDLLRKAKEQKRRQQQQKKDTLSKPAKSTLLEKLPKNDSNAYVDASGILICRVCKIRVQPADYIGWEAHLNAEQHLQNIHSADIKSEIPATATKRIHEEAINSDVSNTLAQQLKIAPDIEVSAQVDASSAANDEENITKRRKVDPAINGMEHTDDKVSDIMNSDEGLPAGFFDDGIKPAEDDTNMDSGNNNATKATGAQSKAPESELSANATDQNKELLESLAAFETEIAELINIDELPADDLISDSDINQEIDLDSQAKKWSERTQHLVHLQSIIKQGLEALDPNESKSSMDEDSNESSEEEYSEFTSWRTGQI